MAIQRAEIVARYRHQFGAEPHRAGRAPGRVNLIGEHTDYNGGYVLPIAIGLSCYAAAGSAPDGHFRAYSVNLNSERRFDLDKPSGQWTDYVAGVARELGATDPFHIIVWSEVPTGAGLSSSASIEVACAIALGGAALSKIDLIRACLRAENDFVGLPCGIMDQYVSVAAHPGCALKIDCATQESEDVPLPVEVSIVAVNSMVKHDLAKSEYPVRVAECKAREPKRWRHVESENARVLEFIAASARGDLARMGELFIASHRSLQHDYEVSCAEVDFLVDTAIALPYVYGARITGGGFGGCTVNLVKPGHEADFEAAIRAAYLGSFGRDPACYRSVPSAGAEELPEPRGA